MTKRVRMPMRPAVPERRIRDEIVEQLDHFRVGRRQGCGRAGDRRGGLGDRGVGGVVAFVLRSPVVLADLRRDEADHAVEALGGERRVLVAQGKTRDEHGDRDQRAEREERAVAEGRGADGDVHFPQPGNRDRGDAEQREDRPFGVRSRIRPAAQMSWVQNRRSRVRSWDSGMSGARRAGRAQVYDIVASIAMPPRPSRAATASGM